jgi:hypothetical protein
MFVRFGFGAGSDTVHTPQTSQEMATSVRSRIKQAQASSIHPVVHVSQLKKVPGPPAWVTPLPDDQALQWSIPEKILQRRTRYVVHSTGVD